MISESRGRHDEFLKQGLRLSAAHLDEAQRDAIAAVEEGTDWFMDDYRWKLICYRDWFSCRRAAGKRIPEAVERVAADLDCATARHSHKSTAVVASLSFLRAVKAGSGLRTVVLGLSC